MQSNLDANTSRSRIKTLCAVLYDVQSYLHPSWHLALPLRAQTSPRSRNQLLHIWLNAHCTAMPASHCARDVLCDVTKPRPHSAALMRCLSEWHNLEGIIYLLGAHACHVALTGTGRLPFLRWQAGAFIGVPIPRPGFIGWAAEVEHILPYASRHGLETDISDRSNTVGHRGTACFDDLSLDHTLFRLGTSIIATVFGSARQQLISRLYLLLPHTAHQAFRRPLPIWRGDAQQAGFLIELAVAFQKASGRAAVMRTPS